LRANALAASGYRCAYCDAYAFSGDHVVPLVQGGRSEPDNTLAACRGCNTSKGGRTLSQWVASGFAPGPAHVLLAQRILDRLPV
jgi:5-methylcytosine-specific restriction endonuclease McrA